MKHVVGARRRDEFFDEYDDVYDDLDDRRPVSPQNRKRPKVPLLPATLSKVGLWLVFAWVTSL